jgi:hypothetical protein
VTRRLFVVAIALGVVLRLAAVQTSGGADLQYFAVWLRGATASSVSAMYRDAAADPRQQVTVNESTLILDYPPVALYLLAGTGHAYQFATGRLDSRVDARTAVRVLIACFSAMTALLVWAFLRWRGNAKAARFAAAGYWANPAVMLHSSALGYLGALVALPAVAAVMAAATSGAFASGALLAIAMLTKPQGILVAPAVVVALRRRGSRALGRALAGGMLAAAIVAIPLAASGSLAAAAQAVFSLITEGTLSSSSATNVWWLVGYSLQVARSIDRLGMSALAQAPRLVSLIGDPAVWGSVGGYGLAAVLTALAGWFVVALPVAWAMWCARQCRDIVVFMALGAFTVHAHFTLGIQAHENHLALAVPLLAFVSASRRGYRYLLAAVSLTAFLNLLLVSAVGTSRELLPLRGLLGVDVSVFLALFNVGLFAVHAAAFKRLCGELEQRDAEGPSVRGLPITSVELACLQPSLCRCDRTLPNGR